MKKGNKPLIFQKIVDKLWPRCTPKKYQPELGSYHPDTSISMDMDVGLP